MDTNLHELGVWVNNPRQAVSALGIDFLGAVSAERAGDMRSQLWFPSNSFTFCAVLTSIEFNL